MRLAGMDRHFVRGEGVWLLDANGRRFLDAYAQYGALALGHNHPAVKRAIADALETCQPAMVQPYAADSAAELAGELYRLSNGHFSRCVFTTSGAETVEAAIKLVRMRSARPLIVSAVGSYHGKTMGALAASDRLEFSLHHHQPASGFARVAYGDIAMLATFLGEHGRQTAGFIVEPIQGERGVFEPPRGYLKAASQLCEEHGVAFIADEIQTGLFRTGLAFACDLDAVVPDLLLIAKALGGGVFPLGACLVTERAWDPEFALCHSSTFANNNVASAVGLAVLRELRERTFQDNLVNIAARLERGLADLACRFPLSISDVRGRGLMRAIELRKPGGNAGYFLTYLHQQGLSAYLFASVLAQNCGVLVLPTLNDDNVVRIAPPLITSPEHITQLLAGLEATLRLWESRSSRQIALALMQAVAEQKTGQYSSPHVGRPHPPPLRLPSRRDRATDAAIDYAFLIHPTEAKDLVLNDPMFARFTPQEFLAYQDYSAQPAARHRVRNTGNGVAHRDPRAGGADRTVVAARANDCARPRGRLQRDCERRRPRAPQRSKACGPRRLYQHLHAQGRRRGGPGTLDHDRKPAHCRHDVQRAAMDTGAATDVDGELPGWNCWSARLGGCTGRAIGCPGAATRNGSGRQSRERHRRARPSRGTSFAVSAAQPQRRPRTPHCSSIAT